MSEKAKDNQQKATNTNRLKNTVKSLVDGMDSFVAAKTVLGEPVNVGDTVILPLVDVSFGVGAGAFGKSGNDGNTGGGMHGKMSPTAVLVVKDGISKVVNIKDQDMLSKVLSMAPDAIDKISSLLKKDGEKSDIDDVINNFKEK